MTPILHPFGRLSQANQEIGLPRGGRLFFRHLSTRSLTAIELSHFALILIYVLMLDGDV